MRYVMVWFACSAGNCEAKAELLVRATLRWSPGGSHPYVALGVELPEGWSAMPSDKLRASFADREKSYCPEHAKEP